KINPMSGLIGLKADDKKIISIIYYISFLRTCLQIELENQ
ncbi:MAG: hypothetical protein ACI9VN_002839, partial [Patescibacteria group bacterium]